MSSNQTFPESTTDGLPLAPSMEPTLESAAMPRRPSGMDRRAVVLCALAVGIGAAAALVAQLLTHLIALITNLAFYGRLSMVEVSPADASVGLWVLLIPVLGALLIGVMARYGSAAIRGHGIPEAMEQVLLNKSRISPRVMFLKPLSAAVAIGTGGPFGSEGPIIATGGALGSVVGQLLRITADERKTLLAAGAAAGMAATFGSPVAAVVLAIELLLFEYRPRSIIPVALATSTATALRFVFMGSAPAFAMPQLAEAGGAALAGYALIGALMGLASVVATRAIYWVEDRFEHLPIHWMWWPALGALPVGIIGYFVPRTLGVGYENIEGILAGGFTATSLALLCVAKFASWSIYLGSGTSGGTLAPLFTVGGALGGLLGMAAAALFPSWGIDPRVAGLVGMAAMFAGASRALLASVIFAFEITRQPLGLLPLLAGCSVSFLLSALFMRHSIMTEKMVRRGVQVPSEYGVDFLEQVLVGRIGRKPVVTLSATQLVGEVRGWLASGAEGSGHQGFPLLDAQGQLLGVLTRRDFTGPRARDDAPLSALVHRPAVVVYEDSTLREAADLMVQARVGRLPVVRREAPLVPVGILTRSDLLVAHETRLAGALHPEQLLDVSRFIPRPRPAS